MSERRSVDLAAPIPPLLLAVLVAFSAAVCSFAGRAPVLGGTCAVLAVVMLLFGRPRAARRMRVIILIGAAVAADAAALLPSLSLVARVDRVLCIVAIALFVAYYEIAPRADRLKPLRPAADVFAWATAAAFLFGPLGLATAEYAAGNAVTTAFHSGVASNAFTRAALLTGVGHDTFVERGSRIFATPMLFDSLHAARFDDNHHIARVATQLLTFQMTPCTMDPDPPQSGYAGPGFGIFIRQITAHCRQ